jgi:hypothetical protein
MTTRRTGKASGDKFNSPQSPEVPSEMMNDNIMSLSVQLKQTIKKVVVHNAIAMAMEDFATGDYGDIEQELFSQFSGGISSTLETQYQGLMEGRTIKQMTLPPAPPASSGEQITSSSST